MALLVMLYITVKGNYAHEREKKNVNMDSLQL